MEKLMMKERGKKREIKMVSLMDFYLEK